MSYTTQTPNVDSAKSDSGKIVTKTFQRVPFEVQAIQVTEENFEDVAAWCGGQIVTVQESQGAMPLDVGTKRYIQVEVKRPTSKRQSEAYVGDWVVYAMKGYKVYGHRPFLKNFEEKPQELFVTNQPADVESAYAKSLAEMKSHAQTVVVNNTVNRELTDAEKEAYLAAKKDAVGVPNDNGPGVGPVEVTDDTTLEEDVAAAVDDAYPAVDPTEPQTIETENHQPEEPIQIRHETNPPAATPTPNVRDVNIAQGGNFGGHH